MNDLPPRPNNVGKSRVIKNIDGQELHVTIEDEIVRQQATSHHGKLIYIQKMRFEEDPRVQYRFAYYMIGVKPGAQGRWVFAQYSPLIPPTDLEWLIQEARRRNWPGF